MEKFFEPKEENIIDIEKKEYKKPSFSKRITRMLALSGLIGLTSLGNINEAKAEDTTSLNTTNKIESFQSEKMVSTNKAENTTSLSTTNKVDDSQSEKKVSTNKFETMVSELMTKPEIRSKKRAEQIAELVLDLQELPGDEEYLEQDQRVIMEELVIQERLRGLLDPKTTALPPDTNEPTK